MNARTRVLLADDHAILRAGLAMLVRAQPDLEVAAEAGDGIEAIEKVRRTKWTTTSRSNGASRTCFGAR